MQIDLANWFEIIATLIAGACWLIKPLRSIGALAVMLCITVGIEFSSKYLYSKYIATHDKPDLYLRLALYSILYNLITLSGSLAIIYYLLHDGKNKKQYLLISLLSVLFVAANFLFGQGYKTYNNYSTVTCWILLIGFSLFKLRTYDEAYYSKHRNFLVLLFLLTTITYYTVNLPSFVFFQRVFKEDPSYGIKIYRAINDNANYFLYLALSAFAILSVVKRKDETNSPLAV